MTLLPDPNRPDLAGTGLQKPAQRQKLMRKKAFLESIGESAAAAAVDVGARSQKAANKGEGEGGLTPSWGDVRGLLDSLTSSSTGSESGKVRDWVQFLRGGVEGEERVHLRDDDRLVRYWFSSWHDSRICSPIFFFFPYPPSIFSMI